ncbi:hypothetical protein HGA13_19490 [Nocardia speluncae]|uniref:Uncharacterized protein n=1 Tax=Nocardia speluncae TaxID=419477 RepID=A0A846XKP7_9NOCA|nr:hypothetical protein [Nocardia speluncae]NKY35236.1 hypothetical protein [Nocardia speluncae]
MTKAVTPTEAPYAERAMVGQWWYDITPGTFVVHEGFYEFKYKPRSRRFGDPDRTMRLPHDKLEAIQIASAE